MNLVETIKDYLLSNDVLAKIAAMLGIGEAQAKTAIGAAVPTMLAGVSAAASTPEGANRVVNSLNGMDPDILGKLGGMLGGGQGGALAEKGGAVLGSLFNGTTLSAIMAALSKFGGLNGETVKKLLAGLAPVVMGAILGQFKGKAPTAAGLTSLMNEQKGNIAAAMPAGLQLPSLGGVADAGAAAMKWLLPALGLVAIAVALFFLFKGPTNPSTPADPNSLKSATEPSQVSGFMTGILGSFTDALSGVKDAATAEAAVPKLADVNTRLDGIKGAWDNLAAGGKATVSAMVKDKLDGLKEMVAKVLAMPGVGDKLKPALDAIMAKITAFAG